MPTNKPMQLLAEDVLTHSFSFNTIHEQSMIRLLCREFNHIVGNSDYYWQARIKAQISSDLPKITHGFDNAKQAYIFHRHKLLILTMDMEDKTSFFTGLAQILGARPHYQQGLLNKALQKFDQYVCEASDVIQLVKFFPGHWQVIVAKAVASPRLGDMLATPLAVREFACDLACLGQHDFAGTQARLEFISSMLLPRVLTNEVFNAHYADSYNFLKLMPMLTKTTTPLFVEKILASAELLQSFIDNSSDLRQLKDKLGDEYNQDLSLKNLQLKFADIQSENTPCFLFNC